MVSRLTTTLLFLIALITPLSQVQAADSLTVEADQTELSDNDIITLTIKSSIELDLTLSDLINFDVSDIPMPDLSPLESDFEILGTPSHRHQIRSTNSSVVNHITWSVQIAPKRTGELEIPPIRFRDQTSEPIPLTVKPGSRDVFIELSTDKDRVYVQEQLVLTIQLYFSGNLLRGELSEPEHATAMIEPLGQQREYNRTRDGQPYRVVERRYAIFPQQPGELTIDPIRFEGQSRDPQGKLRYLRDRAELFDIPVEAPPASFSGDTWLPARDLTLEESGLPKDLTLEQGQNLTRTLSLSAQGLTSEALPPFDSQMPDALRSYPEQPERQTETRPSGLYGRLTQTEALVGVTPGTVTLPEIRIPWWDTRTDTEQMAIIPARTLTINGNAALAAQTTPDSPGRGDTGDEMTDSAGSQVSGSPAPGDGGNFWRYVAVVLALGWAVTTAVLLRRRGKARATPSEEAARPDQNESASFDILLSAAANGQANTPQLLLHWANRRFRPNYFRTLTELLAFLGDPELSQQLRHLQSLHFGRQHEPDSEQHSWSGDALIARLKAIRSEAARPAKPTDSLPPLYPASLAGRS
ncbi:BatD family protein [Marinobacter xestospongiae]|uniref:BatD family protein n=1 Tax=Marinobacter xestospongiae TaxID=994319 RepID=UPI002005F24F|nr:BatD family protein [Marinobacter xestospongiae]MCK7566594.1 BatD family protein [Marinobacter xestospongiae]